VLLELLCRFTIGLGDCDLLDSTARESDVVSEDRGADVTLAAAGLGERERPLIPILSLTSATRTRLLELDATVEGAVSAGSTVGDVDV